jgi:hypothetical protein
MIKKLASPMLYFVKRIVLVYPNATTLAKQLLAKSEIKTLIGSWTLLAVNAKVINW